ncbi:hypothetical protein AAG906_029778 [Vitis piasezkii]
MASYMKKYIWIFHGMHGIGKAMSKGVQIEEVVVWVEAIPKRMVRKVHKWMIGGLHLVTLPLLLLQNLGYLSRQPIRLFCDNKAACDITHNPRQHDRTKHVEVDRFFIKEKLDDKIVELPKIRSEDQLAISSPKRLKTSVLKIFRQVGHV